MKSLLLFLFFLVINCDSNDVDTLQETDKRAIDELKKEIKDLAADSVCSELYSCESIGLGSKPCGGNWEYVVYSTSIDQLPFLAKVQQLNRMEQEYNEKYEIASDCAYVMPPSSITCENGKCVAVYN